jgi:hypothetical protein
MKTDLEMKPEVRYDRFLNGSIPSINRPSRKCCTTAVDVVVTFRGPARLFDPQATACSSTYSFLRRLEQWLFVKNTDPQASP